MTHFVLAQTDEEFAVVVNIMGDPIFGPVMEGFPFDSSTVMKRLKLGDLLPLLCYYKEKLAGLFLFNVWSFITLEVHTFILPPFRGKRAIIMCRKAAEWLFSSTNFRKVVTRVPVHNLPAYALCVGVGMDLEGKIKNSYIHNGKIYDEFIFSYGREKVCQQPL